MSVMLDKLLQGQKVEWLPIENIFNLKNGYTPSKSNQSYWKDGTIPWFRLEDIRENGNILSSALQQVSESAVKGKKIFPKNSFIIATSATIGEHALITVPYLANQRFTNLSLKDEFAESFNIIFLYYYLFKLDDWCKNNTTMSSFAAVDMNGFRKFEIPIPPLDVQAKIVKILDAFTALTTELTAELTMREKQYHYYRDKLLTFSDDVSWVQIGDVATIKGRIGFRGYTVEDFVDEGEGAISLSPGNMINGRFDFKNCRYISWEKYEESPEIQIQKDEVIFVKTGSTAGKVAYVSHLPEKSTLNPQLVVFKNLKCNSKFLFYVLNLNNIQKQISALAKGAIPNISQTALGKIKIPLPSIDEQNRIVSILNKLDTITNSITEGLPKEIALRQQQYEYYREQLLDFPKFS